MKRVNRIIGVIPARLKSTRLPNKILLSIKDKPMVYYTYKNVLKSKLDEVVIAVDNRKVFDILKKLDCNVKMTSSKHKSGTDRVGEISKSIKADYYINIQGDEPLIDPTLINNMIKEVKAKPDIEILTIGKSIKSKKEIEDPNIVKVVFTNNNQALYFSRCSIPYNRENSKTVKHTKHIGIYGYRTDILKTIIKLKPSALERSEKLEQLRFLEKGFKISIIFTGKDTIGVDTKKDFLKVKKIIEGIK